MIYRVNTFSFKKNSFLEFSLSHINMPNSTYECEKCGEVYTNINYKWCKPCQINDLKNNLSSGNKKIDNLIQEMQLKIDFFNDILFNWVPYDQFINIKKIGKNDCFKIYSAIWKDGNCESKYEYINQNEYKHEYIRNQNMKVTLKCLYNSQNLDEFLNEV
jgi:hypothetical protein